MQQPVPDLGLHYMEQWRQEAEAQMVADEAGTAGGRAHGTRGEKRGVAEAEWVESQGGFAAAAALTSAPPSLSELLLSSLVEEAPPGKDKPEPIPRSILTGTITGETPVDKPPQGLLKYLKAPKELESHLKDALVSVGIIDPNWTPCLPQELQNDEICADLRQMTGLLEGMMKRNEGTVARLLDDSSKAGATRATESELSGPKAKEIEERYIKRKRAQKQRKKSKKRKTLPGGEHSVDLLRSLLVGCAGTRRFVRGCLCLTVAVSVSLSVSVCPGPKKNQSLGTSAIQALSTTEGATAEAGEDGAQGEDGGGEGAPAGGDPAFEQSPEGRSMG